MRPYLLLLAAVALAAPPLATLAGTVVDARDGKLLWRFQSGGMGYSNPMSYMHAGKQYIAIAMGNSLLNFCLE